MISLDPFCLLSISFDHPNIQSKKLFSNSLNMFHFALYSYTLASGEICSHLVYIYIYIYILFLSAKYTLLLPFHYKPLLFGRCRIDNVDNTRRCLIGNRIDGLAGFSNVFLKTCS